MNGNDYINETIIPFLVHEYMEEEQKMVKVYITIDEESNITDIGSSIFIENTEDWIIIDEGSGDRYVHAQGNYLPGPIRDEDGKYRYKYVNGEIYEVVQDDEKLTHLVIIPRE